MKLRNKLVAAMLFAIMVPLLLVVGASFALLGYETRTLQNIYGIQFETLLSGGSMEAINHMTKDVQVQIDQVSIDEPSLLEDTEFLDKLNTELSLKYSYLIVRIGDEITYDGDAEQTLTVDELPAFRDSDEYTYIDEDKLFLNQTSFYTADGEEGSVFIVTQRDKIIPELRAILFEMVFAVVSILVISVALLSAWIYREMVKPLRELSDATHKIRDGDLDFELDARDMAGEDEISELFSDFNEMKTRLKESVDEKLQSDAQNRELIRNISHDLKTPITSIKGYIEGIQDGVADTPEKMDRYLKTIYNKANDMNSLIDELSYYAKAQSNRISYSFTRLKVRDYFGDCAEDVGMDLESKGIEFTYSNYCEENVEIIGDPEQLKKVINNIIGNSVKYMDKPKCRINMRISDVGDFIQVEIEDNGKGIGAKELPYIFDRFYRTDSSRNSSTGGSGIGLSIVKKIIEDHNGKVWATSREGIGTVMCFVIRKYQEVYYE